jgi:lipopolysaccharide/colanic/teichoic acid biosynthesis glycosyltransferase
VVARGLDLVLSATALVVLSPLLAALAVAVVADSRGPAVFRQYRVGKNGRQFLFYKFRSMVADAEKQRSRLVTLNEATGPLFKIRNDPRVTRIGRWMRKYSLDELPQLWNVLVGDMSLVGPRPALPKEVEQYTDHQRRRLDVLPGITGLQQVSGRSDLAFEHSVELDLYYIETRTVGLYLKVLLLTFPAVIKSRGAY